MGFVYDWNTAAEAMIAVKDVTGGRYNHKPAIQYDLVNWNVLARRNTSSLMSRKGKNRKPTASLAQAGEMRRGAKVTS